MYRRKKRKKNIKIYVELLLVNESILYFIVVTFKTYGAYVCMKNVQVIYLLSVPKHQTPSAMLHF